MRYVRRTRQELSKDFGLHTEHVFHFGIFFSQCSVLTHVQQLHRFVLHRLQVPIEHWLTQHHNNAVKTNYTRTSRGGATRIVVSAHNHFHGFTSCALIFFRKPDLKWSFVWREVNEIGRFRAPDGPAGTGSSSRI